MTPVQIVVESILRGKQIKPRFVIKNTITETMFSYFLYPQNILEGRATSLYKNYAEDIKLI